MEDKKLCEMIHSDDEGLRDLAYTLIYSKAQISSNYSIPAVFLFEICEAISKKYPILSFNMTLYRTNFSIEMTMFEKRYGEVPEVHMYAISIEGYISKIGSLFLDVRKRKSTRQIREWMEDQAPVLFMRHMKEILSRRSPDRQKTKLKIQ